MPHFACENPPSRIVINIGSLIPYDTSNYREQNNFYLAAKTDGNGPIFIELWPGEV
jgi:hypothetical protein